MIGALGRDQWAPGTSNFPPDTQAPRWLRGLSHQAAAPAARFLYLQGALLTVTIFPFLLTLPILRVRAGNEMSQGLEHKI